MTDPKERLVDFKIPAEPPSRLLAKTIIENLSKNLEPLSGGFRNILDGYDDLGYTPNLAQIERWALRDADAMVQSLAWLYRDGGDASVGIDFTEILIKIRGDNNPNTEEYVNSLAEIFSWMDNPFYRGGTPLDAYWHSVQANSALFQVAHRCGKIVDTLYGLLAFANDCRIDGAKQFAEGFIEDPNIFARSFEGKQEAIKSALLELSEVTDFAVKIGFLFRDAWWLEEHSEAALKGYLAKETARKAGSSGGAASNKARAKRIDAFLTVHAMMMSRNHALADDSPKELAIRALKLAKKHDPGLFSKSTTNKTAIEYWEYIRSDAGLWKKYKEKIKEFQIVR
ncbi:hypothetical protein [Cypionkella psychrotolerans]|uniref:hypothetical protein n=1 Tax=Cypionkella psychrotolerans TaxID=1678131 RepID=UPI0006B5364D|nr:hypothetical protein [Cypionkella psychrotolerans]